MKALKTEIAERKQMMDEDDEHMEALRKKLALYETGNVAEAANIKMKEYTHARQLEKEVLTLRAHIDEMNQNEIARQVMTAIRLQSYYRFSTSA